MRNNTILSLSSIGFSQYALSESGELYKMPASVQLNKDNINRFRLTSDNGITIRITLKKLYRLTFNKEFSVDTIQNLPHEEWKEIENTKGKYFISNCGRVKSLCGYTAKILQQYKKRNGYLIAKINGKNILIHRLVAFAFCENNYKNTAVQIHHKDGNRQNNNYKNLEILSAEEHAKKHNDNGNQEQ